MLLASEGTGPAPPEPQSNQGEDQGFDFGSDLIVTPPQSQTQPQTGQQTPAQAAPQFDPNNIWDWTRVQPNQVPETYRPLAQTAQALAAQVQREITNLRAQQMPPTQQTPTPQPTTTQPAPTTSQRPTVNPVLDESIQVLGAFGYTPQSQGWQEAQTVFSIGRYFYDKARSEYEGQVSELRNTVQAMREQVGMLEFSTAEQRTSSIDAQVREARQKYGILLDTKVNEIGDYWGKVNPATGQPHTVLSAFEYVSGISGRTSQTLQDRQEQILDASRRAAAPIPTAVGGLDGGVNNGGQMSDSQARAAISQLPGFQQ